MEEYNYEKAASELEQILEELKSDTISIDQLAERVEKAGKLIVFCKEKLTATEQNVTEIIQKLGL
nr:exodeoxyribonuclease VII small subunit [uncultured Flavobacterium sp.]